MNTATYTLSKKAVQLALRYMESNPEQNIPRVIDVLSTFALREDMKHTLMQAKKVMADPGNPYRALIVRAFEQLSPQVRKKFVNNFVFNSGMIGQDRAQMLKLEYDCNIPWAILMDPTSACNLRCIGCWAGQYDRTDSMDYSLLDRIIREGKELGVYFYIYSGGEPLIRKDDLLQLAKVHDDCVFLAFTNGTLVDDQFAQALSEAGNFALAFSIEGFESATDFRRGTGTYRKVIEGMDAMRRAGAPFGFSACYHAQNTEAVGSEEFLDFLIGKGCMFGWYFTFMPLGRDASVDLLASPEQRAYMFRWVREMRSRKPIFLLDFWNDGQYSEGCVAGGRSYLHINAAGDVEPCAFIHYSNMNIREVSLLEALRSPLFMEYRKHQPFNENHLRPCPLLDNPDMLAQMVKASGATSTQPIDKEDVISLTDKCRDAAARWAIVADKLWQQELPSYLEAQEKKATLKAIDDRILRACSKHVRIVHQTAPNPREQEHAPDQEHTRGRQTA
ncbi:MAG: radical SAM protein [Spirochaetales bacterium]|nr:radical SAM protein [Spirochaetales bacterium]